MGKRKIGPKRRWKNNKKPKENVWRPKEEVVRESPLFEGYYKLQKIVPEGEWDAFIECLKSDLPTTFRINEADPNYEIIKQNLKTKYHFEGTVEYEGQQISCVHPIEWYENEGAWQIDVHRKKLRKIEAFKELHQYMIALTLSGHIGRQEAVSMLPPMFLDVDKNDLVLDMCAAPGSKTLQILEKVHRSEGNGIVIANDADSKRAYLLTSHLMSNHIIVTTHLGQLFPFLRFDDAEPSSDPTICQSSVFDRILCDVPCSGDGTLRKAPELWMKWTLRAALTLHPLQLAITLQGLKLLKVGGRLVYSTCSFNPLEDEAVVMALIQRCKGAVRIVDVSDRYPKLRRTAGLTTWKVADMENNVYESFESIPEEGRKLYRETMFPPSEAVCREAHIERAMRFLPHHQNTGGFFVCVLEKVRDIPRSEKEVKEEEKEEEKPEEKPEEKEKEEKEMEEEKEEEEEKEDEEEEEENDGELRGLTKQARSTAEKFHNAMIPWNKEGLEQIKSFYGISDDFDWDLLYSRSANHRVLLCVNPVINKLCITSKTARKLKIVNTGLKAFEFNTRRGECSYRVCQDGLSIIRKYMTKRVYPVCVKDFLRVLETQKKSALMEEFSEATQALLKNEAIGACVFELDEEGKKTLSAKWPAFKHYFDELCCCVWRGDKCINVLMTETDIDTMRRVLLMEWRVCYKQRRMIQN